ncbi:MobA/MobL family protein [Paraburkholderia silvatlantica]|uniref:MobA/MobL protein domain-containing protein n=1 Tax=Paraburkholderia silvatlantica TaxID=321895 RepID=A0ABR6FR27_9BURK|nr:MobA/MobL family protein [Paraburkholderia silvatlantica]MBB2929886.1 hypothetical protein [Paraburkholderia silvatlantica]PVY29571.1 MobA/MobL family protein [Paraburkholderia silvatlantica]PXW25267.1 MobA/MobL family protein [Paraburkholderia silvatlantica]
MHVSTHTRGRGHSAVAAAAYRLGATLHDERTGLTHSYAGKGGVMASAHIVPDGAAAELHDVGECWNAVEAAERRKDSQLCRDFREAVPLGLDQEQAETMMNEWAGWLSRRYGTVVTAALHRDNPIDVLGERKADEARGYHIHALMPTRRLGLDGQFGAKLNELSNKTQSAVEVEACRAQWASLCNDYAQRLNLGHTYDHRSHARRGDGIEAEITMGVEAAAMTRRGIETNKAAVLRQQRAERALRQVPEPESAPAQAIIVPMDQETIERFYRLRQTRRDLAALRADVDRATQERDACAAAIRQYAKAETDARGHRQTCQTTIEQATEVIRTTIPLPFGRWKRIRQEQREVMRRNTEHAAHWAEQQASAGERRTYAEAQLPRYTEARAQAERRLTDGQEINASIEWAWGRLTPAQRERIQREDAARQQRAQAQERAEEQRRKQEHDRRPIYEPYQQQPSQPERRRALGLSR